MQNQIAMIKRVVCFLSFFIFSCSVVAQSWNGGNRPKLVVLNKIEFRHEQTTVQAVGTAEAIRSITLFSAAADEVTAVNFTPGQYVNKGDVLLTLDDRRQRVAVKRAEIQLTEAERALQRLIDSQSRGAVAQSEIDLATTTRDLAKVTLEDAKTDLSDRQVIAPFSGYVGLTDVEVGDRITTTTAVTTLDDRHALYVNFRAPEAAINLLTRQSQVELQPWSERDRYLTANIAQLDSRIDTTDRTMAARALLNNQEDQYRPGMSFRVNITLIGNRYAAIPESALLWGATGAYLFKAVDGKATRVDVRVHQRLRGTILVTGDLSEDDLLIAEGIQRLREGQSVTTSLARGKPNE